MKELFGRPTVVELKMVSEDSEKSFLMGMLLRIFCTSIEKHLGPHDRLQHVMLVEEAHRLAEKRGPRAAAAVRVPTQLVKP